VQGKNNKNSLVKMKAKEARRTKSADTLTGISSIESVFQRVYMTLTHQVWRKTCLYKQYN